MAETYCQDVVLIHCPHCGRPIYVDLSLDEWFDYCPGCEKTYGVTIKHYGPQAGQVMVTKGSGRNGRFNG